MVSSRSDLNFALARFPARIRFAIPQAFTAIRVLIGVWALFVAVQNNPELAAKLITVGVITDALDGKSARLLAVISNFGGLFDMFSDYLYYIVVPGVISFQVTEPGLRSFLVLILGLPFVTGAIRYARLFTLSSCESFQEMGTPGLATNVYTFFVVAIVFLRRDGLLQSAQLEQIFLYTIPLFSALFIVPIRFPKLAEHTLVLIPVVAGLNVMPFALSVPLAILTLTLIAIYVLFSPLVINQRPVSDPAAPNRIK